MDRVFNFLGFSHEENPSNTENFVHSNLPPRWIPTQYVANKKIMERELLQKINPETNLTRSLSPQIQAPTTRFSSNLMEKSSLHRSLDEKVKAKLGIHLELLQKGHQLRHVPLPTERGMYFSSMEAPLPPQVDYFTSKVQNPTVVHEHVHPITREVIQPVIYREREQVEVQQVVKNLHQTHIQPTIFLSKDLPAENREIVHQGETQEVRENLALPSVEVDSVVYEKEFMEPIVKETIHRKIVKEIQPVIERDVVQTTIIKETLPIYERIVEAPIVSREILPMKESQFVEKNGDVTVERWEREGMNPPSGMRSK